MPPDDPFAASRDMFSELAGDADPGTAGMTAFQLEELVDERGRELQRQLLQDHLNLRAAREEQQARERRAPVTGTDGITRTRLETGHGRLLATLFGTVRVPRCAWRSPGTGNFCPADAALSLPAGRHSHSLARLAVRSRMPWCRPPPISPRSTPRGFPSRARLDAGGSVRGFQGDRDAAGGPAGCYRQGCRPTGEDADPAVFRGETEPQADGHPRRRLRRRAGEAPPARRDRPARRPARLP